MRYTQDTNRGNMIVDFSLFVRVYIPMQEYN